MTATTVSGAAAAADLVRESLRRLFSEHSDLPVHSDVTVLQRLEEMGWLEVVADNPAMWGVLFEEQGRLAAASPALDLLVVETLRGQGRPVDATGAAVVYPLGLAPALTVAGPSTLAISGITLAGTDRAQRFLVPYSGTDGPEVLVLDRSQTLAATPVAGVDPSAGWRVVAGTVQLAPSHPFRQARGPGSAPLSPGLQGVIDRAIGHELLGLTTALIDIAVEHVLHRRQFGTRIGSFPSVKHRLADAHIAHAAAAAALGEAAADSRPQLALLARTLAAGAHDEASLQSMQVCGAVGFTEEFPLHRLIRRGQLIDSILGTSRQRLDALGMTFRCGVDVPRVPALHW